MATAARMPVTAAIECGVLHIRCEPASAAMTVFGRRFAVPPTATFDISRFQIPRARPSVARRHPAGVSVMLSKFERYPLTFGPTPIEKLSRLTAHLGGDVEIFAKREDCNSGLAFRGNELGKREDRLA